MTRTARQAFVTGGYRADWEKIAQSLPFLAACDYALLAMGEDMPNPLDPTAQAQLVGARKVLDILKTLHEKQEPPKQPKTPSLNYEALNPK